MAHILTDLYDYSNDVELLIYNITQNLVYPYFLFSVCKRWREVIHATPAMWTTAVAINCKGGYRHFLQHKRYSGTLSMHLDLVVDEQEPKSDIVKIIRNELAEDPFMNLEPPVTSVRLIGSTSSLHYLAVLKGLKDLLQDLTQIKGLELVLRGGVGSEDMIWLRGYFERAMSQFTGLTRLSIHGVGFWNAPSVNGTFLFINKPSIPLVQLEELQLTGCNAFSLHLLMLFDMPFLSTLTIDCSKAHLFDKHVTMNGIQRGPFPAVRRAILRSIPTAADITNVLSLIPSVQILALSLPTSAQGIPDEDWVQTLQVDLRRLSQLILFSINAPQVTPSGLKSIASERLDTLKAIEMVQYESWSKLEQAEVAWLRERVHVDMMSKEDMRCDKVITRLIRGGANSTPMVCKFHTRRRST
ncbi:hypothetical protein FRB93_003169 [Tulasnella sp. JGI-2019a]|nr:hypothetical protein FRB93_003169 [Tulasnella sp. JGI-2019a]